MRIGKLKIGSDIALALAPMAGYTDIAYRHLMADLGADLLYTELTSSTSITKQGLDLDSKTGKLLKCTGKKTTAIQLFGSRPSHIKTAVKLIEEKMHTGELKAKLIDLNMGCPAPKVVKTGAGSALLKDPEKMVGIAKAAVDASKDTPITAKIRLGYSRPNNLKVIKRLQDAGICSIAVHARTAAQRYSGKADWSQIALIKKELTIPVIANGDIKNPEDAKKVIEQTDCDGVMIGRAALSNPYIFKQTQEYLKKGSFPIYTRSDNLEFLKRYNRLIKKHDLSFNSLKSLSIQLCTSFRGCSQIRNTLSRSKDADEIFDSFL